MKKETRTVVYDDELRLESYRFEGTQQPFPNHFHEYYVIGFVESGERCLSCKNNEYAIYMVPVITVVTSTLILHEQITALSVIGTLLILAGLFLSERKTMREEVNHGLTK